MIYIKRFNVCLVEIPKTASTSLRKFFIKEVFRPGEDYITYHNNPDLELDYATYRKNPDPNLARKVHVNSRYILKNKLAPPTAKFIAVIREPLERQLSFYLYICKLYDTKNSLINPYDFKETYKKANSIPYDNKKILIDIKGSMESQSSYINRSLNHEFWLYEDLDNHIEKFKNQYNIRSDAYIKKFNVTRPDSNTKDLIDMFYDDELKEIVRKQYADDVKLYNELKDGRYSR